MKPTFLTTLILPALMATAGIAQANEGGNGMEASYLTHAPRQHFFTLTRSRVTKCAAVSKNDEDIGTINDLIIDEDGKINAVVVGVGGFLGMGEKERRHRMGLSGTDEGRR